MKIDFVTSKADIKALKKFIDNYEVKEEELVIQLLGWMWDNLGKINYPQLRDQQFEMEVLTFLQLIEAKE